MMRERAFALILGTLVRDGAEVELAWQAAERLLQVTDHPRPMPPESP